MPHKPTRTPRAQTRIVDPLHRDSHLGRGLAPPAQDVDWDNDATTSFRRTLEDPSWASDEPSWSGDLSNLLEPDAFPELRETPPQPRAAGAQFRRSVVSSAPLALDEPRLAIEGSLARSMRPRRSSWLRGLYFVVPMLAVLGAGAYWNPRGELFAIDDTPWWPLTPPPRSLARGLPSGEIAPAVIDREPELRPEPHATPEVATGVTMPAPEPVDLAALGEPAEVQLDPPPARAHKSKARAQRSARAAARRKQRELSRARQAELARPIMPMPDATPDDVAETPALAANQGVLQINSRPWSRVIVDGKFVGHTPQRSLRLSAGKHRVRLENEPLDMSKIFDVVIMSGRTVTRVEMLEENGTVEPRLAVEPRRDVSPRH